MHANKLEERMKRRQHTQAGDSPRAMQWVVAFDTCYTIGVALFDHSASDERGSPTKNLPYTGGIPLALAIIFASDRR